MADATCSIEGCARRVKGKGLCNTHLERLRIHGSTDDPRPTLADRFWSKVDRSGDCWLWIGASSNGYGVFSVGRKNFRAHRWAYESELGPVPDGLELDHLCRTTLCVNPAHLEAVTHWENMRRSITPAAANITKTTCPLGHPYDIITSQGHRGCRTCKRANARRRAAIKRGDWPALDAYPVEVER